MLWPSLPTKAPNREVEGSGAVDQDKNDQGTTDILEPAGFLVSDQFRGRNMFDFLALFRAQNENLSPLCFLQLLKVD